MCWFNFCMIRRVLSYIMKPPLTKCFCMKVWLSSVWIGNFEYGLHARSCVEMMELLPGIKMVYPFLYELKLCYLRRLFAFEVRYFGIREWKEKIKSGKCYISVLVLCLLVPRPLLYKLSQIRRVNTSFFFNFFRVSLSLPESLND